MASAEIPTFEELREMFQATQKQIAELRLSQAETDRQMKATNRQMCKLTDRIGELVESMVEGGVIRLFQSLGYTFDRCSRRVKFGIKKDGTVGEIDLFLENGMYALLVEIKTNLLADDIEEHIERLQKFRIDSDRRGDKRRFLAAIGGGVVHVDVCNNALKRGFFVIQQSGENVTVIPPQGKPREW
jgi:uncharacterized coiled-coil protein SlyX